MSKELKEMVKGYESAGFTVTRKGGNHLKVYSPTGHMVTVLACTPSDIRAMKNMRAMQKRLLSEVS